MPEKNPQTVKLELLGKLNASFVHEIRNPLFALKLNLDFIKSHENLPVEINDSFVSCMEAVQRIEVLVSDILEFSRKNEPTSNYCSVNEVTSQAINLLNGYARKHYCKIVSELNNDLPKIVFEKNKLLQVFINLIMNAIEASEAAQKIMIKTYMTESYIIWEVEDYGSGIAEENKKLIFEDFYTRKKNGTGLGLGICKKILNEFSAKIDVESNYGEGSRFIISFKLKGDVLS